MQFLQPDLSLWDFILYGILTFVAVSALVTIGRYVLWKFTNRDVYTPNYSRFLFWMAAIFVAYDSYTVLMGEFELWTLATLTVFSLMVIEEGLAFITLKRQAD